MCTDLNVSTAKPNSKIEDCGDQHESGHLKRMVFMIKIIDMIMIIVMMMIIDMMMIIVMTMIIVMIDDN